jgi:hypothetical protein
MPHGTGPKGFITWKPYAKSRALLDQIDRVLSEYTAQLPLTLRQLFYILVGRWAYEKTEQAYDRLGNLLTNAPCRTRPNGCATR